MPYVNHVFWSVRDASAIGVLAAENEAGESNAIDPMSPTNDLEAADDPPAVANVFLLLWPAIQASAWHLSLAQPTTNFLLIDQVETSGNCEGGNAGENLG
jgi:hypothetical protein